MNKLPVKNATLKSILTRSRLLKEAGEKVFARGEEYYDRRLVNLTYHAPREATAEVEGSRPYRVEFGLSNDNQLKVDCACPAMEDFGFCKHAVAFGLFLIDAPAATHKDKPKKEEKDSFATHYPNISGWIRGGWIEIGRDGHSTSLIRVMDEGGLVWEGGTRHRSMDKILDEAERAIGEWLEEN
jgi:hypothetical protein